MASAGQVHLPPEILDHIFKQFIETIPRKCPTGLILSTYGCPVSWNSLKNCNYKALSNENDTSRPTSFTRTWFVTGGATDLLSLRLMCRTWNVLASEIYFSHRKIRIGLQSIWRPHLSGTKSKLQKTVDLYRGTNDNMATNCNVRHLVLNLEKFPTSALIYDTKQDPTGRNGATGRVDLLQRYPGKKGDKLSLSPQNFDKTVALIALSVSSVLCSSLRGIRSLQISLPWLSSGMVNNQAVASYLHPPYLDTIMQAILFGLGGPAFARNLVDLQLTLPTTTNIGDALSTLAEGSPDALKRMQHLYVSVGDFSNTRLTGGNRNIPSNLQARSPNHEHQDKVWEQLVKFPNLESLKFSASDCLDFCRLSNRLAAAPEGSFTKLRVLHLSKVLVTFSALTRLLIPSRIRRVSLSTLVMRCHSSAPHSDEPDTWGDVFSYMRRYCRALEVVYVEDLYYSRMHPRCLRPWYFAKEVPIWSACLDSTRVLEARYGDSVVPFTDDHASFSLLVDCLANRLGGHDFDYEWPSRIVRNREYDVDELPTFDMDEKLGMEDEAALEKGMFDMGKLRMWPRSEFEISRRKKVWPVEDESQEEGEEGEEGEEVGESNVADIHIVDIHIVEDQHVDADG
ncbi:hypothetical protein MGG_00798 [Pyricularia oryzae 70-15]|uniref:Uncharacterized protein n=2 Tax=Pyricularia oryzae TaxID=318829 RepID=G4NEC1_PYRO7|nr:uncharacterized protein MGG_00798 [Pyricularia oryzae 70-15]EHA48604.1 hypothetical protein MGG_00798 [Pyricularia oryzae 70-15]